jgi:uncharacterized protein
LGQQPEVTCRPSTLAAAAVLAAALAFSPGLAARAQTPPSASELAAYGGLHAAAARGDLETIRRLSRSGAALDGQDGNGRTPLHVAAFQSQGSAAGELIAAGANPDRLDRQRYDAVTIAAVRDDVPTLRALLASGASAKLVTSVHDGTALIASAHLGHDEVVKELIRAGALLDHVNNLGWTALIEAVILGDGGRRHTETVRALVAAGASTRLADREGRTPLQHARSRGYDEMSKILERGDRAP